MMPQNYFQEVHVAYAIIHPNEIAMQQIYAEMVQALEKLDLIQQDPDLILAPDTIRQQKLLVLTSKGSIYLNYKWPLILPLKAQYMSPAEQDQITRELNYLTAVSQPHLLDNFENMRTFLKNAYLLDELRFISIAVKLGVGFTDDIFYMNACAALNIEPVYYERKPISTLATPLIYSLPQSASYENLVVTPDAVAQDPTAQFDVLSQSAATTIVVEPTEISATKAEEEQVVETTLESTEISTTDEKQIVETYAGKGHVEWREPVVKESPRAAGQQSNSQIESRESMVTELEQPDAADVGNDSLMIETVKFEETHSKIEPAAQTTSTLEPTAQVTITTVSNQAAKSLQPTVKQIVATLNAKKINDYLQENPWHSKNIWDALRKYAGSDLNPDFISDINCDVGFCKHLLSLRLTPQQYQNVILKVCSYSAKEFYIFNMSHQARVKQLANAETMEKYSARFVVANNWFVAEEQQLLRKFEKGSQGEEIDRDDFELFANTKNAQGQSLLSLALQQRLKAKTVQMLIKKSQAASFELDQNNMHPICYLLQRNSIDAGLTNELWQKYVDFIAQENLSELLEKAIDAKGNTILHQLMLQIFPDLVLKVLNKIFDLPNNSAITSLLLVKNHTNQTPLDLACRKPDGWDVVIDRMLLELTSIAGQPNKAKFTLDQALIAYYVKNNLLERLFNVIERYKALLPRQSPRLAKRQLTNKNDLQPKSSQDLELLRGVFKDAKLRVDLLEAIRKQNNIKMEFRFRKEVYTLFPQDITINCSLAWVKLKAQCSGNSEIKLHKEDVDELSNFVAATAAIAAKEKHVFDGRLYIIDFVLLSRNIDQIQMIKYLIEKCGLVLTDGMCCYALTKLEPNNVLTYILQQHRKSISKQEDSTFALRLYMSVIIFNPSEKKIQWLLDNKYNYAATFPNGNNILHQFVEIINDGFVITDNIYNALEHLLLANKVLNELHDAENNARQNYLTFLQNIYTDPNNRNRAQLGPLQEFKEFILDLKLTNSWHCVPKSYKTHPKTTLFFSVAGLSLSMQALGYFVGLALLQSQSRPEP